MFITGVMFLRFRPVCILTRGVSCAEGAGERESVSQEGQTGPSEAPQGFPLMLIRLWC